MGRREVWDTEAYIYIEIDFHLQICWSVALPVGSASSLQPQSGDIVSSATSAASSPSSGRTRNPLCSMTILTRDGLLPESR